MLHPGFPVLEGYQQISSSWAITLPCRFNRRIEDGSLVLWRPGTTIWLNVYGNDRDETKEARLEWIRNEMSPSATKVETEDAANITHFSYLLKEKRDNRSVHALYAYAISSKGHAQTSIYFEDVYVLRLAKQIARSLSEP